ncbi:hypothetical protein EGW08_009100 [Elysia chlorotica]|uniref:Uncharacterized protein n=1 Tax=Elysia chlorotica TaxID=188477 RepID=A0A433TNJ9_ELYCH|nr:hypothetical protein EGW08_009100 [Elysia chlorotica]
MYPSTKVYTARAIFGIAILIPLRTVATNYPWLNDNDVKVINRTTTSVVLAWHLPKEMTASEVKNYRLLVTHWRRGYSPNTINARPSDPDCSLLLSHCHLRNLVSGEAYSVILTIDYLHNDTTLGRANLPFATIDASNKDGEVLWWLLYVAVPAALAILLLLTVFCIARCCGCWCWRKKKVQFKKTHKTTEGGKGTESSKESSESSSEDRKHSLQTRQWVKDTLATIDLDPESSMYDQPEASTATYDCPQGPDSPSSGCAASGKTRSHFYMEFIDSPPSPAKKRNKAASTLPGTKSKDKKIKKSHSNSGVLTSSAELPSPVANQDTRPSPKPCRMKPQVNMVHKSSPVPSMQPKQPLPNLRQDTPPASPLSELQQKLQGKLQQQQQQSQGEGQTQVDTPVYANTEDLTKLKGNARRMFPML